MPLTPDERNACTAVHTLLSRQVREAQQLHDARDKLTVLLQADEQLAALGRDIAAAQQRLGDLGLQARTIEAAVVAAAATKSGAEAEAQTALDKLAAVQGETRKAEATHQKRLGELELGYQDRRRKLEEEYQGLRRELVKETDELIARKTQIEADLDAIAQRASGRK